MHPSGIDLQPLPNYSFSERPRSVEIGLEEAQTALWRSRGDVSAAADLLKVPSDRLRRRIGKSAKLQALCIELDERILDRARSNLVDALHSEESKERAWSTRYALSSSKGSSRGWGPRVDGAGNTQVNERVIITWGDGSVVAEWGPEAAPVIEHDGSDQSDC